MSRIDDRTARCFFCSTKVVEKRPAAARNFSANGKEDPGRTNVANGRGPFTEFAIRTLNLAVATLGLIFLSPALVAITVAIKLDSPGPVLFRQLRVGRDERGGRSDRTGGRRTKDLGGKPFVMYKFRTMHVDAEMDTGPTWAAPDDRRTTRVGRFLRRYRLDEIPQLWNVLRGEMSVVGPRPERPKMVQELREEIDEYPRRHRVRPGITGWAQLNQDADGSVEDVRQKLRYDLEYLRNRSVLFDLRIMARTPQVMVNRETLKRSVPEEEGGDTIAAPSSGPSRFPHPESAGS